MATTLKKQGNLLDNLLALNMELEARDAKLKAAEAFADRVLSEADVPEEDDIASEIEKAETVLGADLDVLLKESIDDEEAEIE